MYYYEILVSGAAYHGQDALTYGSEAPLERGAVVRVQVRSASALGIVVRATAKPDFKVKQVDHLFAIVLPEESFKLIEWLRDYYSAPIGLAAQLFLPKSLSEKRTVSPVIRVPALNRIVFPVPSEEQREALQQIAGPGVFVLHGDTGSGKTYVYAQLASRALAAGKSVIVLTPEIGLTSQLEATFREYFGPRIIIMHSQLSGVDRQKAWTAVAQSSKPIVVIGARSALFGPLRNVGLIIVDEAHEDAYKQEQAPRYHALRVAAKLGQLHGATVVFGSATPSVIEYFLAEQKNRPIVRMKKLALGTDQDQPMIEIVDLRDQSQHSSTPALSKKMLAAMRETLGRHEQVLLFLNRRGTARVIFCEHCGWQATCSRCDLPLVYHGDEHVMRCHICGFQRSAVSSCPDCEHPNVVFKTIGTKAVAETVAALFPYARVQRFDNDNKRLERIEKYYDALRKGNIDIVVGTQTIAKGLDLPKLGLVGVIMADASLYLPDFTSQERTYQLLAQVLGRVGRGHRMSRAIIQTYAPESPLLRAAVAKDWESFYQKELAERAGFMFPPFSYMLKLWCRRADSLTARKAAEKLAESLQAQKLRIAIEGPAPSFHEKIRGKYEWQLIIKSKNRTELLKIIALLPSGWSFDIDPTNLL